MFLKRTFLNKKHPPTYYWDCHIYFVRSEYQLLPGSTLLVMGHMGYAKDNRSQILMFWALFMGRAKQQDHKIMSLTMPHIFKREIATSHSRARTCFVFFQCAASNTMVRYVFPATGVSVKQKKEHSTSSLNAFIPMDSDVHCLFAISDVASRSMYTIVKGSWQSILCPRKRTSNGAPNPGTAKEIWRNGLPDSKHATQLVVSASLVG